MIPGKALPRICWYGAYGEIYLAERRHSVRRALRVHPLSTYLVFQALTPLLALPYTGVFAMNGISMSRWLGTWVMIWAELAVVALVWTQLVWGPCWKAGADYGLSAGVRIGLMTVSGGALLLPFLVLNVVLDPVWFFYVVYLTPYGLVVGLLGGTVLAIRDRGTFPATHPHDAPDVAQQQ